MGYDGWGSSRVANPPKPTSIEGVVSDLDRRQRQDDRALRSTGPMPIGGSHANKDTTGSLDGSGLATLSITVPASAREAFGALYASVSSDATGEVGWATIGGSFGFPLYGGGGRVGIPILMVPGYVYSVDFWVPTATSGTAELSAVYAI